jgi:hypothetical protein
VDQLRVWLWRVLKRRLYGARAGLPLDSPDQLTWEFIKYVLRSDRLTRPKFQKLHLEAGSTPFFSPAKHTRDQQLSLSTSCASKKPLNAAHE